MDKRYEQKVKTKIYKGMTGYSTSHFPTHQIYKIKSLHCVGYRELGV